MRDFGVGKKSLEDVIQDEAKLLGDIFASKEGEAVADVKRMMTTSTCNVIHHVVFGFRYIVFMTGFVASVILSQFSRIFALNQDVQLEFLITH
jgi:hypothetical protein